MLRQHLEHGRLDGVRLLSLLQLIPARLNHVPDRQAGRDGLLKARRLDVYDAGGWIVARNALLVHWHAVRLALPMENSGGLLVLLLAPGSAPRSNIHDRRYNTEDPVSRKMGFTVDEKLTIE
jgi:hypothetical protein